MAEEDFERVIAAAAAGGEWAFAALWRALNPPIIRYLRVAVPDVADDLASETWLQIARDISSFEGSEAAFRAWAFTIARNRVIDHRRAQRRRPKASSVDVVPDRPSGPDPADELHQRISTAEALAMIGRLPSDQAEAITLRVVAGLEIAEIARIMGKRPGTVRVLAHRGLRRLADLISKDRGPDV